jgi:hypothetical protein
MRDYVAQPQLYSVPRVEVRLKFVALCGKKILTINGKRNVNVVYKRVGLSTTSVYVERK